MDPLVLRDGVADQAFFASAGAWGIGEVVLALRRGPRVEAARADEPVDRSQAPLFAATAASLWAGVGLAKVTDGFGLPGGDTWPVLAGLAIFWAAIALRVWAIRTLGRFFRCVVVVQAGHRVIDTGPYALIRHPSYLGLVGALLGLGTALDSWAAIVVCVIPPLIGFSIRLSTEERVLADELGEPYRAYMRRTRRLIPGVW